MRHRSRKWRLNVRAVIVLGVIVAFAIPALATLSIVRTWWARAALMRQAEAYARAKPPKYDLALAYINHYLDSQPDDPTALELKSEILAETAHNGDHLLGAIKLGEQAVRLAPDAARSQVLRRRVVDLYLRMGRYVPSDEVRLGTAEAVAREMVARGEKTSKIVPPEDRRLLARVLEQRAALGDPRALEEAIANYERARQVEPGDVAGAVALAAIYQDPARGNDPAKAAKVLDDLLAADPSAATRLARHRLFAHAIDDAAAAERKRDFAVRAAEELRAALALKPNDPDVLLTAAEYSLQRGDADDARRYFTKLPARARDDIRARLVQGLIDLREDQTEDAIDAWRRGLVAAGGTSVELTWRLAYVLLQLGRTDEAEPLLQQYRRLVGGLEPDAGSLFLDGLKRMRRNRPTEAIGQFAKARFKIGSAWESQLHYAMGQCYEAVRDEPQALEQYALAAAGDPKWPAPRLARANLLMIRHPDDAAVEIRRALADMPDDPTLLVGLARAELETQLRKPSAERSWAELDKAIARARVAAPAAPALAGLQAEYRATLGRLDQAAAVLEQAVRHDPKEPNLWVAWAGALVREGKTEAARVMLERASAPDAAGDRAAIRIARARLMTQLGQGKAAREALVRDDDRLRPDERPLVWAELGNLLQQRREMVQARKAYARWAELLPDDPQPRLFLLELAFQDGDQSSVQASLDALKQIGGGNGLYSRLANIQELLRDPSTGQAESSKARAARLDKAEILIAALEADEPRLRFGYLLRGMLCERRNEPDRAIAAYEQALEHDGGLTAIQRLAVLYARQGRLADVERLRREQGDAALTVPRLTTMELLKLGKKEAAEQWAKRVVEGQPDSLDARMWEARVLGSLGKADEAERSLRDLVARHRDDAGAWLALLFFQIGRKHDKPALETIEQIRKNVTHVDVPEFLWAQCYRAAGDTNQAEALYKVSLAKWPNDPRVVRGAAAFFESIGRVDDAEVCLRELVKRDPSQHWAVRALALLVSGRPKDPNSWEDAWKMVAEPPAGGDTPDDRLVRAVVLTRSADSARVREAVALLEDLIADLPADLPAAVSARNHLSRLYLQHGQSEKARALTAIDATGGGSAAAVVAYAEALIRDKKLPEAMRQLARLKAMDPSGLAAMKLEALILHARERPAEAAVLLEQAFTIRESAVDGEAACREILALLGGTSTPVIVDVPAVAERIGRHMAARWPATSWMLGQILFRQDRDDEALDLCETTVDETGGRDAQEACALAVHIATRPQSTDAQKARADAVLAAAVKRDPNESELLLMTAFLRHAQQRYKEEAELYRIAEAARPSNPLFLNNLAWVLSEELGRPDEGLNTINGLIERIGEDPSVLDTRAIILSRLGRAAEAVKDLERALKARPNDPTYAYHLARAYAKAGDERNAAKYRELARQLGLNADLVEPGERTEMKRFMGR